jgi:mono/diheme cytochrome c family protein
VPTVQALSLYDRFCLACHGAKGDGQGPAAPWLWPQPRDFTSGEFKWRSTPTGEPPLDDDLARAIRWGVPGTSMHGFGDSLQVEQIAALVVLVKSFATEPSTESGQPVAVPPRPADAAAAIDRGKTLYRELGCDKCHGAAGKGDGPSARELRDSQDRPAALYDLTARPVRRPRAAAGDVAEAIWLSLATGLSGTPMPMYAGAAPDRDLWAVALYIDSIRAREPAARPSAASTVDPIIIDRDRRRRVVGTGRAPNGVGGEARIFGSMVTAQGTPPRSLTPAQASLDARQCERCHAKQAREWQPSFHAGAGSPGLLAQLIEMQAQGKNQDIEGCQRCHAPLAEQQPVVRPAHRGGADDALTYQPNPSFEGELREQGVSCASCHVRGWRRYGPPRVAESRLLALPSYPLTELAVYERADFCIACHQLPPRTAVNGKPRLNTYREWLEGPYMRRGVQCQHCHMPNREHTWKGVHDPDTFRQGIDLDTLASRNPNTKTVTVRARVTNVGAGHFLPTTPTPAAWLSIELVDAGGERIDGAFAEKRIGWHLEFTGKGWKEIEDTRIPPGESLELARAWKQGGVSGATHARITVRVHPDDFYEGLYAGRLARKPTGEVKRLFQIALERATGSHYIAVERLVPIR